MRFNLFAFIILFSSELFTPVSFLLAEGYLTVMNWTKELLRLTNSCCSDIKWVFYYIYIYMYMYMYMYQYFKYTIHNI